MKYYWDHYFNPSMTNCRFEAFFRGTLLASFVIVAFEIVCRWSKILLGLSCLL